MLSLLVPLLACCQAAGGVSSGEGRLRDTLESLARTVSSVEAITSDVTSTYHRRDGKSGELRRGEQSRTISTLLVGSRSRARVEFRPLITKWQGGSAEFFEEHHELVFDGVSCTKLRFSYGAEGKAVPMATPALELLTDTVEIDAAYESSVIQATVFGDYLPGQTTVNYLAERRSVTPECVSASIVGDRANEIQLVVTSPDASIVETWVFDSSRDNSLLQFTKTIASRVTASLRIEELSAHAGGRYFPKRATRERFNKAGECIMRRHWEVAEVAFHADSRVADSWQSRSDAGTRVIDAVIGAQRVVARPDDAVSSQISDEIRAARVARSQHAAQVDSVTQNRNTPFWLLVGGALLIIPLVAVRKLRGKFMKNAHCLGLFMLASAIGAAPLYGRDEGLIMMPPGSYKFENCGVNTAAFVLGYYERRQSLEQISIAVDAGSKREREVTLLALRRILEAHGLTVMAYKETRFEECMRRLDGSNVAILHLFEPGADSGHFVIATAYDANCLPFVVDAGKRCAWATEESARELASQFSGTWLLVSALTPETQVWALTADEIPVALTLDKGRIGERCERLVRIRNDVSTALRLASTKSSCGCFEYARLTGGANELAAGAEGELKIGLRTAQLSAGSQQLRLRWVDDAGRELFTIVRIEVSGTAEPLRVLVIPEQFNYGTMSSSNRSMTSSRVGEKREYRERVQVIRPIGYAVAQCEFDAKLIKDVRHLETRRFGTRACDAYEVVFEHSSGDVLDATLTFRITGSEDATAILRILGDASLRVPSVHDK
ncbi:MAG: hypothetical protein JNL90_00160 [Planctomycetes bacterium]|nr:hypothetical protein [Planctomycetota bacterium]